MAKSSKRSGGPRRPVGRRHPTTIPSAVLLALLLLTAAASATIRLPGGGKGSGGGGGAFPLPWGIRSGVLSQEARGGAAGSSTIPRSTSSAHRSSISDPSPSSTSGSSAAAQSQSHSHPPWNPSAQIDDDGFLRTTYTLLPGEWEPEAAIGGKHGAPSGRYYRTLHRVPVTVRQVPGDGNCLFHSIATCLAHAVNGTHICMRDTSILRSHSALLRTAAVDCLSRSPNRRLFLQGSEYLRAGELVTAAAAQYDLTGEEYCDQMRRDSYWGGGPEIVALCNVLRRPIHVYELCSDAVVPTDLDDEEMDEDNEGGGGGRQLIRGGSKSTTPTQFRLRRMACFGSPRFDRREPLHILSADSRFPDIQPGRQLSTGNHFLALFPDPKEAVRRGGGSPRRVRGGGASSSSSSSSSSASSVRRRNGVDNDDGKRRSATTGSRKKKKVRPTPSDDEIQDREGSSIWGRVADRVGRILDWE